MSSRRAACNARLRVRRGKGAGERRRAVVGLLAGRARRQGAHLKTSPCASVHLVRGRVTDEGVIFHLQTVRCFREFAGMSRCCLKRCVVRINNYRHCSFSWVSLYIIIYNMSCITHPSLKQGRACCSTFVELMPLHYTKPARGHGTLFALARFSHLGVFVWGGVSPPCGLSACWAP